MCVKNEKLNISEILLITKNFFEILSFGKNWKGIKNKRV